MTKDKALKLALDYIVATNKSSEFWLIPASNLNNTVTAIKEALAQPAVSETHKQEPVATVAEVHMSRYTIEWTNGPLPEGTKLYDAAQPKEPEQEPVAWLHTKIEGVTVPHRPADLDKHPDRWEALYKTPSPCPTCEALARTVMLDQTSHDTAPPTQFSQRSKDEL